MKRKFFILLLSLVCAFCLIFALAGCEPAANNQSGIQQGGVKPHTHNYVYKCSQTEHWQACTVCGEEKDRGVHTVSDGVCLACGYVEKCTEGLEFTKLEENEEIIGYSVSMGTATDSHIFIPSFYKNLPVISICNYAFEDCTNLKEITIPDSVTSIDGRTFFNCTSLKEITIPDSVTSIYMEAFYNCRSLTEIIIPDSVTSIGSSAFYDTAYYNDDTNWKNGVLYIGNYLIEAKDTLSGNYQITPGTKLIAGSAFQGCINLTEISIPDSVTSIGSSAFYNCRSLKEITIPNSVTSICDGAFASCTSLKEITIPNSVTSIGYRAFNGCTSLKEITIPDSVTSIGWDAFGYCESLEGVYINDIVAWYNIDFEEYSANPLSYAHNLYLKGQLVTNLEIPNGVTAIKNYAFTGCTSLKEVTIPANVTSIRSEAFSGCTNLESIIVDKDNKVYRSEGNCIIETETKTVIVGCKNSKIPDSVTSIGYGAFSGCTSLTEITIPDSVTFIGNYAFSGCTSLESVTFTNSNGWYCASGWGTNISSNDLQNSETAAKYLNDTYKSYYWARR